MWRGLALAAGLFVTGCATAPLEAEGWVRRDVTAAGRVLATATPRGQARGEVLTVIIEGDGRAHDWTGRPTADPTPARPVGLAIARAWPDGPRAWLGRPCQFVRRVDPLCRAKDWTIDRFASTALAALDAGVDDLKRRAGAERVVLVGWSGGGVMAAALAARRDDVAGLVTLAAPLDVAGWTAARGLTPLNLAPAVRALPSRPLATPQVHLLGARDRVVPPAPNLAAARAMAGGGVAEAVAEAHECCWDRRAAGAAARLRLLPLSNNSPDKRGRDG